MQRLRGEEPAAGRVHIVFHVLWGGQPGLPALPRLPGGYEHRPAMAGFILSAIGFPVLGVIAVAKADGLRHLAGRVHPVFAAVFTLLVYLSIGPGLAIPRTASTSFEMVAPLAGGGGSALQAGYSAVFFAVALLIALRPESRPTARASCSARR